MFGNRQQLDVGVTEILHVGNQFGNEFVPPVEAAIVMPPPGTGMQLVDADRAMLPVEVRTCSDPVAIAPRIARVFGHAAGGFRARKHLPCIGVGLSHQLTMLAEDFVLVGMSRNETRNEQLPDTGGATAAHGMAPAIPCVEVADHADALNGGRPHGKQAACHAIDGFQARTKDFPGLEVTPLTQQIQIHLAQLRAKRIGAMHGVPIA